MKIFVQVEEGEVTHRYIHQMNRPSAEIGSIMERMDAQGLEYRLQVSSEEPDWPGWADGEPELVDHTRPPALESVGFRNLDGLQIIFDVVIAIEALLNADYRVLVQVPQCTTHHTCWCLFFPRNTKTPTIGMYDVDPTPHFYRLMRYEALPEHAIYSGERPKENYELRSSDQDTFATMAQKATAQYVPEEFIRYSSGISWWGSPEAYVAASGLQLVEIVR